MEGRMLRIMRMVWILIVACPSLFAAAQVDANSEALLRQVAAQFQKAQSAEVDLRITANVTEESETNKTSEDMVANYKLVIARPNRFALQCVDSKIREGTSELSGGGASAYSDGTNVTTSIGKSYMVRPAGKDLRNLESDSGNTMGAMAFISALFSAEPYQAILSGVIEATNAPPEKLAGLTFDRVNFRQEGLAWNLLATHGTNPALRRIEVFIPQLHLTLDFNGWKFNGPIPPNRFEFSPPADAKKVDSLTDGSDKEEEGEDSDLIGEALPQFKVKTIDGGTFDSASLKNKEALLVFWAGEAEHCVNALRVSAALAKETKGLVYQTVNVDEMPDNAKIKALLERNKLPGKAAVDEKRELIDELGIEGVPLTFLIDKKGIVRKAFLGYHKDYGDLLKKEIEAVRKPE